MQFLPDEGICPIIEPQDEHLALEDADFAPSNKLAGNIIGFDNIHVYDVCTKHACLNKELVDGICPNCFSSQDKDKKKKYMRATLTIQDSTGTKGIKNLSIFYPEYSALCAYMDIKAELDVIKTVQDNFQLFLGQEITYDLKKTSLANISLKRKHQE